MWYVLVVVVLVLIAHDVCSPDCTTDPHICRCVVLSCSVCCLYGMVVWWSITKSNGHHSVRLTWRHAVPIVASTYGICHVSGKSRVQRIGTTDRLSCCSSTADTRTKSLISRGTLTINGLLLRSQKITSCKYGKWRYVYVMCCAVLCAVASISTIRLCAHTRFCGSFCTNCFCMNCRRTFTAMKQRVRTQRLHRRRLRVPHLQRVTKYQICIHVQYSRLHHHWLNQTQRMILITVARTPNPSLSLIFSVDMFCWE